MTDSDRARSWSGCLVQFYPGFGRSKRTPLKIQTPLSIPIIKQIGACPNPGAAPSTVLGVQIPGPIFGQARSPAQAWGLVARMQTAERPRALNSRRWIWDATISLRNPWCCTNFGMLSGFRYFGMPRADRIF
eukprot:1088608-Pleurochrysis_carterae.AAC.1